MQIQSEIFEKDLPRHISWEELTFRFCEFRGFDMEGGCITSNFIDCTFEDCELYWGFFNGVALVGVSFRNCIFRGSFFSGCRLVECTFDNCLFTKDNLDGDCRFDNSRWYGCKQSGTEGLSIEWASI
ncbi:pentapeptide repeat-containing protein [Dyella silvatica]|uniref:pentapeptide repeat-containing protein n=1 Tax=Dyella silvatica TaxID=2992128 RepID=UPI003CCDBC7F